MGPVGRRTLRRRRNRPPSRRWVSVPWPLPWPRPRERSRGVGGPGQAAQRAVHDEVADDHHVQAAEDPQRFAQADVLCEPARGEDADRRGGEGRGQHGAPDPAEHVRRGGPLDADRLFFCRVSSASMLFTSRRAMPTVEGGWEACCRTSRVNSSAAVAATAGTAAPSTPVGVGLPGEHGLCTVVREETATAWYRVASSLPDGQAVKLPAVNPETVLAVRTARWALRSARDAGLRACRYRPNGPEKTRRSRRVRVFGDMSALPKLIATSAWRGRARVPRRPQPQKGSLGERAGEVGALPT